MRLEKFIGFFKRVIKNRNSTSGAYYRGNNHSTRYHNNIKGAHFIPVICKNLADLLKITKTCWNDKSELENGERLSFMKIWLAIGCYRPEHKSQRESIGINWCSNYANSPYIVRFGMETAKSVVHVLYLWHIRTSKPCKPIFPHRGR